MKDWSAKAMATKSLARQDWPAKAMASQESS